MTNAIIDAIARAISSAFGDEYTIYSESVAQNLKEPCFILDAPSSALNVFLGNRYKSKGLFCVNYLPEGPDASEECNAAASKLYWVLERIVLENGNSINGANLRSEVIDNILHFFVSYDAFLLKPIADEKMEILKQNISTEGEE